MAGLYRLWLLADVERHRHGGGGLLHRRMRQSGSGCQDRHEPRRRLRGVHLHSDPGRLHRRSRGEGACRSSLADPKTIFVTFAGKVFPGIGGEFLNWIIAFMLIVALALSALNAILGSGRALYQMALDGEFPTLFAKINEHGVPARAMGFNVVASLIIVLLGGAVEIYSFSNVGYTVSFLPVLIGYYLLRQDKPHLRRPFKLPEFMKYVALAWRRSFSSSGSSAASGTRRSAMSRSITGLAGRRCSLTCLSIGTGSTSKTSGRPRSKASAKPA